MNITTEFSASRADKPTLTQWLQHRSLEEIKASATETVRKKPASARDRWLLYQLLCIDGEWERALRQLQTWATLEPDSDARAQLHRGLVRAEAFRAEVFAGTREPGFVSPPPAWVETLLQANVRLAHENLAEADALREAALDEAAATRGEGPRLGAFAWLTESDTRLGPVCEMVTGAGYRWIPFAQMRSLRIEPAGTLTDVVWLPARVVMHDDAVFNGYLPTRYPGSESGPEPIRLARETRWSCAGETTVIGLGQKTWTTDAGDWGLLEIGACRFTQEAGDAAV